ncbi:MAG TPA: HAMP domain-containing sensor histidine kinase, partial [Candidatus Thermoplasmatota archaeon]|nr:HAMP domain-containing sensor histidine kinase [Candidatus Thermoplasmatota archaeon]
MARWSDTRAGAPASRLGAGLLLVLSVIAVSYLASVTLLRGSLPLLGVLYAFTLAAVVAAAFLGGTRGGLLASVPAGAYALWHYYQLEGIFPAPRDRLVLGVSVVVITFGIAAVTGHLRRREEARAKALLDAEHAHGEAQRAKAVELERANQTLEAFTYVVSHDLKEPVRALVEYNRALLHDHGDALDPEAKELVERSRDAGERLARLLEGLLEYARASQIQPHELVPLRVEDALGAAECAARFENVLRERNARLDVTPGPAVHASLTGICQVLGNLVLNALKHNPRPAPVVRIHSRTDPEDPRMVSLVVEDNGPGFPPELVRMFNDARRGRPSTLRGGFGLIITRQAVEKMGGWME